MEPIPDVRIFPWEMICSLCFENAFTETRYGSSSHLIAFSRSVEPRSLDSCSKVIDYKDHPFSAFIAHTSCFKIVKKIVEQSLDPASLHTRLVILSDSLRYRWPVPSSLRRMRTRKIATRSFEEFCRDAQYSKADTCLSNILNVIKTLPTELRTYIFDLSASSGIEKLCTLKAMARSLLSGINDHISYEPANRNDFGELLGELMGERYLSQTSINAHDVGQRPIIASFDDVACLDISYLNSQCRSPRARWYRILASGDVNNISVSYKGYFLQDVVSKSGLWSNYMWSTPNPPMLNLRNSYYLPPNDRNFEHQDYRPIRLQESKVPKEISAISVACGSSTNGITRLVHFHSSPKPAPTIYRGVDRDLHPEERELVWLYLPFNQGEVIKDIFVRDHHDDGFPCCPYLNILTSSGRVMSFGPWQSPERRYKINHSYLIDNDGEELSALYYNVAADLLRVGVTCRPSVSPYISPRNFWGDCLGEEPQTLPPTTAFDDHWYFSRADLRRYYELQACIDMSKTNERCIGLLLHGPDGSHSLGQWRWDKHITRKTTLCTSLLLEHFTEENMPGVKLVNHLSNSSATFTPLRGILEWWTGPLGTKVSFVPPSANAESI